MSATWQLVVTLAIVAVAVAYLGWRGWRVFRRKSGGCGTSCGGCDIRQPGETAVVVELSESFDSPVTTRH
jgi:hypothetical protein